MELVGLNKKGTDSELIEKITQESQERAEARNEKQAELHAELQNDVEELRKVSKVNQIEFNKIIDKYGTGEYARSLITKTPYIKTRTGAGLW